MKAVQNDPQNRVELRRLSPDEGGGWLATFPDLPGCLSDGETPEEALHNATEAEAAWLEANRTWTGTVGKPARLVARLPRGLHHSLQQKALREGVSLNTMIVTLLAHGLGQDGSSVL